MASKLSWLVDSFYVHDDGTIEDRMELKLELYNKSTGYGWIHLGGKSPETRDWLLGNSGIEEIWIDALLAKETRPRFVKISSDSFFINLRGINSFNKEEPEDMISIRLYITKNQIISTKMRDLKAVDKLKKDFLTDNLPKTTSEFLLGLIEHINDEIETTIIEIHNEIDDLEELALTEHDKDFRQDVIDIRRQMIIFRRYLFPNLDVLHQLLVMDSFFETDSELRSNLLESGHKMTRFTEEIVSIRERAQVVHEELNNHLTERLSASTNKLSVVATIFLPMSFITGLFGVNLAGIPGAEGSNSFAIFAIVTLAILIIQILIFRWFKWF
ncbi:MAG: zinc transporter ZntB [Rickettsiaceae bacterium]